MKSLKLKKKVHHFFFNGVVYHQFDRVKKIFIKLLGIEFPDATELSKLLHKRNNIVHRFSFSNIDRMTMIEITMKDIVYLIEQSNYFVNNLINNLKKAHPNIPS